MTKTHPAQNMEGFTVRRRDGYRLYVDDGSASNANDTDFQSSYGNIEMDIRNVGLNGLDVGTPVDGEDYFIYLIKETTTNELEAVFSKQISMSLVVVPTGYVMFRKLNWGFVFDVARWGGIIPHHISIDNNEVVFTSPENTPAYSPCYNFVGLGWTAIDLSAWMPDNARLAKLLFTVKSNSGSGSVKYKVMGVNGLEIFQGSCVLDLVTRSNHVIYVKTIGDAVLDLTQLGYTMTEAS